VGKGESEPLTGNECSKMGPERGSNKRLVSCLQPDRRVEIEVLGHRQAAQGSEPSTAGAGAPAGASGAPSSSGSGAPTGSDTGYRAPRQ
jgi:hypothetical protein